MPLCKKCNNPDAEFYAYRTYHCKDCEKEVARRWRRANKDRVNAGQKRQYLRLREEVLDAYGRACDCCGESRPEFLALDHRNGGGCEHRRKLGGSGTEAVYRDAKRRGFPKDVFRLLCHNCNHSYGAYGYCPHQLEKAATQAV